MSEVQSYIMKYKILTFKHIPEWLSFSNQKRYISLYTCMPEYVQADPKT